MAGQIRHRCSGCGAILTRDESDAGEAIIGSGHDTICADCARAELGILIGGAVERLRRRANMSQEGAGKAAGLSQSRWADIEANRFSPTLDTVGVVARALGVPVRDLFPADGE